MNEKLVKLLSNQGKQYSDLFENFPYKNDLRAVSEHAEKFYLKPLKVKIIPLLVRELNGKKNESLDNYLVFIEEKFHHFVLSEIAEIQKQDDYYHKEVNKALGKAFVEGLLENSNKELEDKEQFVETFLEENKTKILSLSRVRPEIFLKTIGDMRNPKVQYALLNVEGEVRDNCRDFISSLTLAQLDQCIETYFIYPQDNTVEDYYEKWIGKDSIHIKFASYIFGEKYEYAKDRLKRGKKTDNNQDIPAFMLPPKVVESKKKSGSTKAKKGIMKKLPSLPKIKLFKKKEK